MIQIVHAHVRPRAYRHSRRVQRRLAEFAYGHALEKAGLDASVNRSDSHSRGVSGAAIMPSGLIGLDIEFAQTTRDWPAILSVFCADGDLVSRLSVNQSTRVWTYIEAWYKAFAVWPGAVEIECFLDFPAGQLAEFGAGRWAWSREIYPGFQLCVVWEGRADLPAITDLGLAPFASPHGVSECE